LVARASALDIEEGDPAVWHGLYMGAAGVVWALDYLARVGLHEPRLDYTALARHVMESYPKRPEFDDAGESVDRRSWDRSACLAVSADPRGRRPSGRTCRRLRESDTLELMWGSPGLLILADVMLTRTADQRWASASRALADHLMLRYGEHVPGFWTQRLYGSRGEHIGPAHGMAGIVAAPARRPELMPLDALASATSQALAASAVREGTLANWPPALQERLEHRSGTIRTQWCHGAPGVVASLAALPHEAQLDSLLTAGGELTWTAGPLRKGANLCHGNQRERLRLSQALHPHWRRDLARSCEAFRTPCQRPSCHRPAATRPRAILAVDRRSRHRCLSPPMHHRHFRNAEPGHLLTDGHGPTTNR
jgi:hypothetical protein